jgi:rod shape determining protein RodA
MFVEYHRRILIQPLTDFLSEEGASKLVFAVRSLGKKIWQLTDGQNYDSAMITQYKLQSALPDKESYDLLGRAVIHVKREYGGILLQFFENHQLIYIIAGLAIFICIALWVNKIISGRNYRKIMIPLGVLGITLITAVMFNKYISFSDYQINRLTAFVNPEKFKDRAGYQLRASKIASGSGRIFGKGITYEGMTSGILPLVPEASTDFSFASWAERFGFFGSVFLLIVLMAIPLRGLQVAFESKDKFGAILAGGITAMIFYHLFINIGIILGFMPVTGIPLSFVSYGGSNLIISYMGIGLLLNIRLRKHVN